LAAYFATRKKSLKPSQADILSSDAHEEKEEEYRTQCQQEDG
jgi:hypothetical protein